MGQIAVIGPANPSGEEYGTARTVGCLIARDHETLVCGGLSGVMEAACQGAQEQGGLTVGIVPDSGNGNQYLDIVIRSGLGHARNALVVQSSDAVIAIGGRLRDPLGDCSRTKGKSTGLWHKNMGDQGGNKMCNA